MARNINSLVTSSAHDLEVSNDIYNREITIDDFDIDTIEWMKKYCKNDDVFALCGAVVQETKKINISTLFDELSKYAEHFYGRALPLKLVIVNDNLRIYRADNTIYTNPTMSTAFFSYIATQMFHSYTLGNTDDELYSFRYTLSILNNMCYGDFKLPIIIHDRESSLSLLEKFIDKKHLLDLVTDIYFSSMAFGISHEIAHSYLNHYGGIYDINIEIDADTSAFKMLIDFCNDVSDKRIESNFYECMQPHVYMAPMYLLEFYYVIYYTGSFLCPHAEAVAKKFFDDIVKRKESMMEVFYEYENVKEDHLAYDLYNFYLNGQEHFLRQFIASDESGTLNRIKIDNVRRASI